MDRKQAVAILKDVISVAKYFAWDSEKGGERAREIMDKIHNGESRDIGGIWPQAEAAIETLIEKPVKLALNFSDHGAAMHVGGHVDYFTRIVEVESNDLAKLLDPENNKWSNVNISVVRGEDGVLA